MLKAENRDAVTPLPSLCEKRAKDGTPASLLASGEVNWPAAALFSWRLTDRIVDFDHATAGHVARAFQGYFTVRWHLHELATGQSALAAVFEFNYAGGRGLVGFVIDLDGHANQSIVLGNNRVGDQVRAVGMISLPCLDERNRMSRFASSCATRDAPAHNPRSDIEAAK